MKIGAITMVYRDYWALSQWYAHYSRQIGSDNLFIVAHGHDSKISEICPKAEVITVPRDDLTGFDKRRNAMLNSMQREMSEYYDWVIRTDADELVCLDPTVFRSFDELLSNRSSHALFALGMNIAERPDDPELVGNENVFSKRSLALLSGHYSKAWVGRNGFGLDMHGVQVAPEQLQTFEYDLPKGVYLAHLKYANIAALAEANRHRREIAKGAEKGLPGTAWSKADRISKQFFAKAEAYPEVEWDKAVSDAHAVQSVNPNRMKSNIVRGRFNAFKFKTTLPDWFGSTD